MVRLVKRIIHEKQEKNDPLDAPRDVLDVLLKDESEQLTEELISNNMIDLMIPGEDSVPLLMTLAVKFLADCPPALQHLKVRNFTYPSFQISIQRRLINALNKFIVVAMKCNSKDNSCLFCSKRTWS